MPEAQIGLYDPIAMTQAVLQLKRPQSFLRDKFFRVRHTNETLKFLVDFKRGQRRMAPIVSRLIGGKVVDRIPFHSFTFEPPLVGPTKVITWDDAIKRLPGESPFDGKSTEERIAALIGQDLIELEDMIDRREEWMCQQALFTGQLELQGDGYTLNVDYLLNQKYTLALGSTWADAGSHPLTDLANWSIGIQKKSGRKPNTCVMSFDVAMTFVNHPDVQELANILKIRLLTITPNLRDLGGAYLIGQFDVPGFGPLEIWVYNEWFIDDNGVEQSMVPQGALLISYSPEGEIQILSTPVDGIPGFRIEYGAYTDVAIQQSFATTRYARSWEDRDANQRKLQIAALPLPVLCDIDAWAVAQVLEQVA